MDCTSIIEKINSPSDLKKLNLDKMKQLANQMREPIVERVNLLGGHIGGNLGIIETTIAMHYVFNSPIDKLIFDVSHQSYPHKILTGRKQGFIKPIDTKISGYTNPSESVHDVFAVGHTSTSISLALGLAEARDLKNEKYNVIAIIGDGSLSGGEALEGLNNASVFKSNFIIVLNDNEMSIAENHGGIYKNLENLRKSNGTCKNNIFKAMGFDYLYVEKGNDIEELINVFEKVKDINHPIVVHVHTLKGNGYKPAENEKEKYHWIANGFLDKNNIKYEENYYDITKSFILDKKSKNKPFKLITAATPGAFGYDVKFRSALDNNYIDVAISEEHAVAYASGIAKME